ncbi:MAG TPA: acyl carrier protein [Longimicrobiales bacterium]|jgi:acyl carrier protein
MSETEERTISRWVSDRVLPPGTEPVAVDTPLLTEVGLDSVHLVELVAFLEAEYGVEVPDGHLTPENFRDVRSIVGMMGRLRTEPTQRS